MKLNEIEPAALSEFFRTETGARVLAVARGETPVSIIMDLSQDELDMVRTLLIFWSKALKYI